MRVEKAAILLRMRISRLYRKVSRERFDFVDSDTFANIVAFTEEGLRMHVPILYRVLEPLERLVFVNRNTIVQIGQKPEI